MTAPHLYRLAYRQQVTDDLEAARAAVVERRAELEAARGSRDEKRCRRRLGRAEKRLAHAKKAAR